VTQSVPPSPATSSAVTRRRSPLPIWGSLRIRLTLAFLALMTLAVAAVAFFSARTIRAELSEDVGANLHAAAQSQALAVGDLLARQVHTLQAFGLSKVVQDGVVAANIAYTAQPDAIRVQIQILDRQGATAGDADPLVRAPCQRYRLRAT
jgi:hypothetical protein